MTSENTMIRLTDCDSEELWFRDITHLEVYLSDVAKQDYINQVIPRLQAGERRFEVANGSESDLYEVLPGIELEVVDSATDTVAEVTGMMHTVKFVAQYVPADGRTWTDLVPCGTQTEAEAEIAKNIGLWNVAKKNVQRNRPVRYRVIRRAVIEVVVAEINDEVK